MAFPVNTSDPLWDRNWPSPIMFHDANPGKALAQEPNYYLDPENVERIYDERMRVFGQLYNTTENSDPVMKERYARYYKKMPKFTFQHSTKKSAGQAVAENESTSNCLAFQVLFFLFLFSLSSFLSVIMIFWVLETNAGNHAHPGCARRRAHGHQGVWASRGGLHWSSKCAQWKGIQGHWGCHPWCQTNLA
jgi:hypothetical protein